MKTASLNIRTKETKSTANCPRPTAYLNILRILFAIWVVFVHYGNFISITSGPIKTIMSLGRVATSGFFLISGFLFHITYFDKIKTKKTNGTDFFVGKVIYFLPYILFSTIALFSFASIDLMVNNSTIANPSLMNVIKCLFPFGGVFSSNISYNGNWFLGVLFFCYFLAYIIAVFCRKKDNFILTGIVPLILSIGMFFCSKKTHHSLTLGLERAYLVFCWILFGGLSIKF